MKLTYDEIISTVQALMVRTDAPVGDFIKRGEAHIRPLIRHYLAETTVALPVTANVAVLPADFLEVRAITGTKTYKPVNPANAKLYFDEVGYYRSNNTLVFVGQPDPEVTILYAASIPGISPTSTNFIADRFPNLYIAVIMRFFYQWERDAEGVQLETASLNEALAVVAEDDKRGRQTGQIIMGVQPW